MPLTVGQSVPDVPLVAITPDGPDAKDKAALFGGKKVVLFGLPGAFTGTCSNAHLPGYMKNADAIKAKGIDTIAVVSVNDAYVMTAWKESAGAGDEVLFLADGSAKFTQAADMVLDLTDAGLGIRSLRYAAVVDDGVVTHLAVEESPGEAVASGAEAMLAMLDGK